MPRAKQRTPALRARIYDAAVLTLATQGPAGVTARQIALEADTSVAAIYELFGSKTGLVREMFFTGFGQLGAELSELAVSADPEVGVADTMLTMRAFALTHRALWAVMFGRPFTEFDPEPDEAEAGRSTREHITGRIRRCIDEGTIHGDASDIAHLFLAIVLGLAAQELAGWLATSPGSADRRWRLAATTFLGAFRTAP